MIAVSLMMILGTSLASASSVRGYMDGGSGNYVYGWAWDSSNPDSSVSVQIIVKKASDNSGSGKDRYGRPIPGRSSE